MEELKFPNMSIETERVNGAFSKLGEKIWESIAQATEAFVNLAKSIVELPSWNTILRYLEELTKAEKDREKALKLGLVSKKVVDLSYRRDKVGTKNLNRIRRSLHQWEKLHKSSTSFNGTEKSLENT